MWERKTDLFGMILLVVGVGLFLTNFTAPVADGTGRALAVAGFVLAGLGIFLANLSVVRASPAPTVDEPSPPAPVPLVPSVPRPHTHTLRVNSTERTQGYLRKIHVCSDPDCDYRLIFEYPEQTTE